LIKVFAFDFDGIILESVSVKDQAIFDLFDDATRQERKRLLDLHRKTPGINREDRIHMLLREGLGKKEVSPDLVNRLLRRFASLVWDCLMKCPEVPGIRLFLEQIYRRIPCYVVSAAPQDEVRAVAEARDFSRYFVDIFGTPPAKNERLKEIMNRENVHGQSILFIGDKISDFKAAQSAGTIFLGRKTPGNNATKFPDKTMVVTEFQTDILKKIGFYFQTEM
jgi:phosphoglycolate phosphatase-like HAD superfamily hydrolase